MTKATIWMPLYVGDYLADTQHLTTEQHGVYFLLLMAYWRGGPLPDDDAALATITRVSPLVWRKHRPTLLRFFQVANGVWHHKRVDAELAKAAANVEKYHERARIAAEARWGKPFNKDASSNARSNASSTPQGLLGQCPSPSPSPSPEVQHFHERGYAD